MNTITINNETKYRKYNFLTNLLDYALCEQKVSNGVLSVILVDEKTIQTLNKIYRGIDKITDVISFAFEDNQDLVYNEFRLLGDIYICIPKMQSQAIEYGHSEKRELSFLAIHGLLHLLGYDHLNKEDEEIMNNIQEMILDAQNIKRTD